MPKMFNIVTNGDNPSYPATTKQKLTQRVKAITASQQGTEPKDSYSNERVGEDSLNGWVKKNVGQIEVTEGRL